MKRYKEPAWNNPVVRFVDGSGRDIVPRQAGDWTLPTLVSRMTAALRGAGREVPVYLDLFHRELNPKARRTACFAWG